MPGVITPTVRTRPGAEADQIPRAVLDCMSSWVPDGFQASGCQPEGSGRRVLSGNSSSARCAGNAIASAGARRPQATREGIAETPVPERRDLAVPVDQHARPAVPRGPVQPSMAIWPCGPNTGPSRGRRWR